MPDITLGLDSSLLAGILAIVCIAVAAGFFVRKNTLFDAPYDFISIGFYFVLIVWVALAAYCGQPAAFPVFFLIAYLLGWALGLYVVQKISLKFLLINKGDDLFLHFRIVKGEFYDHPKQGLCRLPETNSELFNLIFRQVYHKVEITAPLDVVAYIERDGERQRPKWDGKAHDNLVDQKTGKRLVLVEDIKTTTKLDKGRIVDKKVFKTVITIAYGSMIPRAYLLEEIDTLDQMNRNVSAAVSKNVDTRTRIISKLPLIAAEQLIAIADDNPVMEIVGQFMDPDKKRREESPDKGKGGK
jgi:hypothetical protein